MSEFGSTKSPSSSKRRKLDDKGLPPSVSTNLLNDVLSLESSHTSPSRDKSREDLSDVESSKSSSEVGLSGSATTRGDDDSSLSEGPDCPFIVPYDWEVNKHCSFLSAKRLLKIQIGFQIPHNVATRLAKFGEKCYSHDGKGNSRSTFMWAQELWGITNEGQETLSLNEFLYCHKPVRVPRVKEMYYFKCRKEECKLVTKVPSFNRDWKRKFFFVNGSN